MTLRRLTVWSAMRVTLAAAVVVLIGGTARVDAEDAAVPADTILFDVFYINYAAGFACGGSYIDASGAVHRYDCRALGDSIRAPEYHGRETTLLERRFGMRDSVVCMVDPQELAEARALVDEASRKPPLEPRHTGCDVGGWGCTAYRYDPVNGERTDVLLAEGGDWLRDPSSPAARRLVEWLRGVCRPRDRAAPATDSGH